MKKTFQYNKQGEIASYSDKKLKTNKFEQIEVNITKTQLEKIESNNYNLFIRDKKLVLEEGEYLIRKREREQNDQEFKQLLTQAKQKYGELTPLFEKIINLKNT